VEFNLELSLQIWKELKPHLISGDITEAADDFIHVLIENGFSPNEIIEYAVDEELKLALRGLADDEHFDDEDDDEYFAEMYQDIDGC